MLTVLGKFFTSIAIGVSSLFGIHHTQPIQSISVPLETASTTEPTSPSISTETKVVVPVKPVSTQQTLPANQAATSPIVTNSQRQETVEGPSMPKADIVTIPSEPVTPSVTKAKAIAETTVSVTSVPATDPYQGFVISWKSENSSSCTLNSSPALLASKGSQTTGIIYSPTTFTVTCSGVDNSESASDSVTLSPYPKCSTTIEKRDYTGSLINGQCLVLN